MINEIAVGDCLNVLQTIEDNSFDAVVTDPPYGIGFNYIRGKEATCTPEQYWEWFSPIFDLIKSKAKPGAFIAIWQAQMYFRYFWQWYGQNIHIYCAAKNFVQLRKTPINFGYDPVVMFYKDGAPPLYPKNQDRSVDFFVSNTAGVISNVKNIEKKHPCPRPLDQVATIIKNFACENALVLDPFLGSGTTAVACLDTGRRFFGIEKEKEYVMIAHERINSCQRKTIDNKQLSLFE